MSELSKAEAAVKLAKAVEMAKSSDLREIFSELFPERRLPSHLKASKLAEHVRHKLEAEELVDLWNVMFPKDRNVWYDELLDSIRYNEDILGSLD